MPLGEDPTGFVDPFGDMDTAVVLGEGEVVSGDSNAGGESVYDSVVAATNGEHSDEGGDVVTGNVTEATFQNGTTFEDPKNETERDGKGERNKMKTKYIAQNI